MGRAVRVHGGTSAGRHLALCVCLLTVAACSSPEPFAGRDIAPTGSPSVSVTPSATPPVGHRIVRGDGFSMAVPGDWEEMQRSVTGGQISRWSEARKGGGPQTVVAVVLDTDPAEPLLEQSYRLEQRLRSEGIDVIRSTSVRPDVTDPAVLVQWQERGRGDGQARTVWQLFVQSPGGIMNVVGYAPSDGFLASDVPKVMGTFEVSP